METFNPVDFRLPIASFHIIKAVSKVVLLSSLRLQTAKLHSAISHMARLMTNYMLPGLTLRKSNSFGWAASYKINTML